MSNTETYRVRYSRNENKVPKNTLVTIRDGENIYFGISRCNTLAGDSFRRDQGKLIALRRAILAGNETDKHGSNQLGVAFKLHQSGLRGSVKRENILELLNFFKNVDNVLYNQAIENRKSRRAEVV